MQCSDTPYSTRRIAGAEQQRLIDCSVNHAKSCWSLTLEFIIYKIRCRQCNAVLCSTVQVTIRHGTLADMFGYPY